MEVHHHPHVGKKNIKEYLLEGLMIFLAVSMGFIAENIREKVIENERAEELAKVLYEEVKTDSVNMVAILQLRDYKEEALKHLIQYFKDSSLTNPTQSFYTSFTWFNNTANFFEPNDGMLDQLKNSGALRYFKDLQLQKDIANFGKQINLIRTRNANEYTFTVTIGRQFSIKHFDFEWFQLLIENGKYSLIESLLQKRVDKIIDTKPTIKNLASFNKDEALGILGQNLLIFQGTRALFYNKYIAANHQLLETLRNTYHIEKK
jgi:hypothetical protein